VDVRPLSPGNDLRAASILDSAAGSTQEDSDEARAAQGEFLLALGMRSELVQ
jgi:hypothetical protein